MPGEPSLPVNLTDDQSAQWRHLHRLGGGAPAAASVHGTHDEFTVSATPETVFPLTCIPVDGTCAMYVNGLEQEEGTDYTVDYDTTSGTVGLVTFVTGLTTGDRINFRYLVTDWLVARSLPADLGEDILVPWNATGWKYKQVTRTDATDYSASTYNDSAWSTGRAPFGADNAGGHGFDSYGGYNTAWTLDTRMWIRRDVGTVDTSRTVTVSIRIDNTVSVWWNDTLIINEYSDPDGGLVDPYTVTVPSGALNTTTNILAIRATDDGPQPTDKSVIDCQVVELV